MRLTKDVRDSYCTSWNNQAASILKLLAPNAQTTDGSVASTYKFPFTHVAAWGNPTRTTMADYVEIMDAGDQATPNTGDCLVVQAIDILRI